MTATVKHLRRFLDSLPDDLEVRMQVNGEERPINSLIAEQTRDLGTDELRHTKSVVLSSGYYGT